MKPRDILIVCVALIVSIGVAFGTRYILHGGGSSSSITKVMVAAGNLSIGTRIDQASFRWQDWPAETVQPNYITDENKEAVDSFMGMLVRSHISDGEPIQKANLVGEKGYLSAILGKGMRAFTIPLENKSNVSGKVLPEDHVDVIVAMRDHDNYVARTVVRNVRVLVINDTMDPSEAEDKSHPKVSEITLEVTPKQAELLAAALREGTPVISLHSITGGDEAPEQEEVKQKVDDTTLTIFRGNESQKIQVKN